MSGLIVNPGSGRIAAAGTGWTNSYAGALAQARLWLTRLAADGIADVELLDMPAPGLGDGRWRFGFRHTVTGVVVELQTHGIDDHAAYMAEHTFPPRVYWRGSSSANPELADWAAPGYMQTFRPAGQR